MVGLPLMSRVHILSKLYCPWTAEGHKQTCERIRRWCEKDHVRSVPLGCSVQCNTVRQCFPFTRCDRVGQLFLPIKFLPFAFTEKGGPPRNSLTNLLGTPTQFQIWPAALGLRARSERSSFRLTTSQVWAKINFAVFAICLVLISRVLIQCDHISPVNYGNFCVFCIFSGTLKLSFLQPF